RRSARARNPRSSGSHPRRERWAAPRTSAATRRRGRAARRSRSGASPCGGATIRPSTAPAPPVMHEIVDHFAELADGAAFTHQIARRRVHGHHAVADAPAPLSLGVEPDDALHTLADQPQRPRLRIVVVVPRVTE